MKSIVLFLCLCSILTAQSYFSDGVLHVISSSHQDIGWMDTPAACAAYRDTAVITPALKLLADNLDYCYSVESALSFVEYMQRHPDKRDEIETFMKSGRLEWGATYQQPYESMYSGEALIRQVYLGRKLLKEQFPDANPRVYWNPDVPARAMQMPQILKKSGIDYMIISRHGEGLFRWGSPDGSSVVTWSPGHYYNASRKMMNVTEDHELVFKDLNKIAETYQKYLKKWSPYYRDHSIPPHMGALLSRDMFTPRNMDDFFTEWNESISPQYQLPKMQYSTIEKFLDSVMAGHPNLDKITGERPNLWLYIHGPTHHKALSAGRAAARLLVAAEKWAIIDALLENDFEHYPQEQLEEAWMDAIYPDHGWGGKNGHITDRVFRQKFESAEKSGQALLDASLASLAAKVKLKDTGIPVIVFNPMSWNRTEPVTCIVAVEGRAYPHLGTNLNYKVVDEQGERIPHQFIIDKDKELDNELCVTFVAKDVPSMGYKTFYLVQKDSTDVDAPVKAKAENKFYKIEFGHGGIKSLFDKELGVEIFSTDKFLGGELFSMQSVGQGAGEWTLIQHPSMEDFEKASDYRPEWNIVKAGPVRTTWEFTQRLDHATVRQRVILYHNVKRIDFQADILGWDGTPYREFRLAFPLNMKEYDIAYEVPMGVVKVGKSEIEGAAGRSASYINYTQTCSKVHPREVQDWFHANNGDWGVTMSSSVAAFDWIDPTDQPVDVPVLQPLLLASRRSCNQEGNWYLQAGDHSFRFSLTSHKNDWSGSFHSSIGAVQPMFAIADPKQHETAFLPQSKSFFSIDASNVLISTIKKCDESDHVVLRLYECEGRTTTIQFQSFLPVSNINKTNMIEEPDCKNSIQSKNGLKIGAYSIETLELKF